MCGIAIPMGYLWLRKWNKEGYEGLKDKEGKKGRPAKLTYWTTKKVKILIRKRDLQWNTQRIR